MSFSSSVEILGISLLATLIACILILRRDHRAFGRIDPLNPGLAFLAYYVIYNLTVFLIHWDFQAPGAREYAELALLGALGILTGTVVAQAVQPTSAGPVHSRIVPVRPMAGAAFALMVVSLALVLVMYQRRLGLAALLTSPSVTRAETRYGILSGAFQTFPVGAGICIVCLCRLRHRLRFLAALAIAVGVGAFFVLSASRGEALIACLLAVYLYHYNVRRLRWQSVAIFAVVAIAALQVMQLSRAGQHEGVEGMTRIVSDREVVSDFMGDLRRFEPFQCGERGMELVNDGPPDGRMLLGSSYGATVLLLPPGSVSPWRRPENLDRWYVRTYHPEIYDRGGGYGFPPLVEAFFNFGPAGCFFVFGAMALIINLVHLSSCRAPGGSILRFANCLLACVLPEFMRGAFAGIFKSVIAALVIPGILLAWACIRVAGAGDASEWQAAGPQGTEDRAP